MPDTFEVFAVIDGERDYQYDRWFHACQAADIPYRPDSEKAVAEWLTFIEGEYYEAVSTARHVAGSPLLEHFRKLAALCVACMEHCGAYERSGKWHAAPLSRKLVYQIIVGERKYQDSLGPERTDSAQHSASGHLVVFGTYLRRALDGWTENPGDDVAIDNIRKLAAIAVRCMESHGIVPRTPFEA